MVLPGQDRRYGALCGKTGIEGVAVDTEYPRGIEVFVVAKREDNPCNVLSEVEERFAVPRY